MKRIICSFLILVFGLFSFFTTAIANNDTVLFFESDSNRYEANTTFDLSIKISSVTDLFGYSIKIRFDEQKLSFINVVEGDLLKSSGKDTVFENVVDAGKGEILVASALLGKSDGVSGDGILFILSFQGKYPGNCYFNFFDSYLKNTILLDIPFTTKSFGIEIFKVEESPLLFVDPMTLDFGNVKFGENPSLKFRISNKGKGELSGEVSSLNPWIKVDPQRFYGDTEVNVTVSTTMIVPNSSYSGEVKVKSNGGEASIIIKIYLIYETPKEPPPLKILTPENNLLTNENKVFILCETTPNCFAAINEQRVAVDSEDGIFWYNANLKEGINTLTISVWDAYENKKVETLTVIRDTTPPDLVVDNIPILTSLNEFNVSGRTDPDAVLTFNDTPVELSADGSFTVKYVVKDEINQLIFKARDSLYNTKIVVRVCFYSPPLKNKIELTVGKNIANFNGIQFLLDAPPVVNDGRVMVPLRAIADIFGAEVDWFSEQKQVVITLRFEKIVLTVGQNRAIVSGREVLLDAAPIINNGRVMVPIRFISEVFKSEVSWVAETKTVIVRF